MFTKLAWLITIVGIALSSSAEAQQQAKPPVVGFIPFSGDPTNPGPLVPLAGGLVFYAASRNDLYRGAANYVDRILKGGNPSDLPVEQPKKFDLILNLRAAKQIGLTIPPNVLARADRVIK
jgi:putative ABC transport system substrate-binding protein